MTDGNFTAQLDKIKDGQAPPRDEIRVRFGPRPTQVVPLDWAESMLTELKRINPGLFGKLLTAASDGGK